MVDESNPDETMPARPSRRAAVTIAAGVAVTAPAVTLLLNAASKNAFAQASDYTVPQSHMLDDSTFGNEEVDIDGAIFGNSNLTHGVRNQDDQL
ncbi:MAG: hypothetical protein AB7H71_03085 [Alphaproteobacteria bacterium]